MKKTATGAPGAPALPDPDSARMFLQVLARHGMGTDNFDAASSIVALQDWAHAQTLIADANAGETARIMASMSFTDLVSYGAIRELMEAPDVQAALARGPSSRLLLIVQVPTFDWVASFDTAFDLTFMQLQSEFELECGRVQCRSFDLATRAHQRIYEDMKSSHVVVYVDDRRLGLATLDEIADARLELELSSDAIAFGVTATFGTEESYPTTFDEAVRATPTSLLNTLTDRFAEARSFIEKAIAVHAADMRRQADASTEKASEKADTVSDLYVADDCVVVISKPPGKLTSDAERIWKMFDNLADKPLGPMLHLGARSLSSIEVDWPHAVDVIRRMTSDLVVGEPIRFRPTLLVGEPGSGKTSLLMAIADALELPATVFPCASSSDNSFGGTAQRWSSAAASTPLEAIRQSGIPNPIVILDEIEKSAQESKHGTVPDTILPMLEPHTAARYFEAGLNVSADLSHVSFLATANSLSISAPLRDRFRILRMPDPGPEHVGVLGRRIVERLAQERGQDGLVPPLDPDEEDVVRKAWGGGSLRKLRRAVEVTLDVRDRMAVRQ